MGSVLSSVVPESDIEGYHIMHVYENSPAQKAGIEAFFDFMVAINGVVLLGNHDVFLDLLKKNRSDRLDVKLFSVRTNTFRHVSVGPYGDWNSEGLIGLTLNFCAVKDALDNVYHVLEVRPNSPAEMAGLHAFSDYIFGVESIVENENLDFMTIIKVYDQRELKMFVYNVDTDACRAVMIRPDSQWRGVGALGCGLGTGYIHRIPTEIHPRQTSFIVEDSVRRCGQAVKTDNTNNAKHSREGSNEGENDDPAHFTIEIPTETDEEKAKSRSQSPSSPQSTAATTQETVA